jgi:hypothetical protein
MKLVCTLFGHNRHRTETWHDDLNFRAPCRRCRTPMINDGLTRKWRPYAEFDAHPDRRAIRS